jgi:hypothetical protein
MIGEFFDRVDHAGLPSHTWTRWRVSDDIEEADLVRLVAESIVVHRCVGAPQFAAAWQRVVSDGAPYSDLEKRALIAFLSPLLGEPGRHLPPDQVEGAVAEQLWFLLAAVPPTDGSVFRIHGPKFHATSPGGDGLVIYDGDQPEFRLWEVKKHASAASVSSTVRAAYRQLKASAEKYLAHYSAAGQEADDPRWKRIYAELFERWATADSRAGVGIAVATSTAPNQCFSTYPTHFPGFPAKHCRHAIVAGLGNFPSFAVKVRDLAWTGL